MQSFTPETARALSAPFADERAAAAERAAAMPWPTVADEIWRYSRIGEIDLDAYAIGALETTVVAHGGADVYVTTDPARHTAMPVVVDGDAPDVFAELNLAFAQAPTVVRVPAGKAVADPIVVTHHATSAGSVTFPRLIIDAGENSEVTVIERFTSSDESLLVVPVVQVRAARAARVKYLSVNQLSERALSIGHQQADGDADSTISLSTVALGAYYARTRTEVRATGKGASSKQTALYFASGDQMHDFRTIQDHVAPNTTSDLLFKGAVQDKSAGVYTGLIKVRPDARGTAAFQTNRNLTLGEGAWAKSVPNLDIETNDVRCSHASTVGPIDPEHRFYLESRGVPTPVAERLIVLGFFDEVLAGLPVAELAAELRQQVSDKLHATDEVTS